MSNNGRITLCPYYRNEKGLSITCEDVYRRFETKADKRHHKFKYCSEAWKECPYAIELNELYEKMEGQDVSNVDRLRQKCNAQEKEIKKLVTMLGKSEKRAKELEKANENLQKLYVKWQDKAKESKEAELRSFDELNALSDIITGRMVYLMIMHTDGKLDEKEYEKWAEDKEFALYAEADENGKTAMWTAEVRTGAKE